MAHLLPLSRGSYLPYWLLLMSFLAFFNTYLCYVTFVPADKDAHPNIAYPLTNQLTPLAARFYGTWTAVSGILRLVTAYKMNEKGLYFTTWAGFVVTCLNFGSEVLVYETTTWGSLGVGLALDIFTVVWMGWCLL